MALCSTVRLTAAPFPFQLEPVGVIDGWDEALSILPEGTRALLIIPPDIAYGANGSGTIPLIRR